MSDAPPEVREAKRPAVLLRRMGDVHTFEVMDFELRALDALYAEESQALGFTTGAGGVLVGLIATLATSTSLAPERLAVIVALAGVAAATTLWSAMSWRRARRGRPALLQQIRDRVQVDDTPAA